MTEKIMQSVEKVAIGAIVSILGTFISITPAFAQYYSQGSDPLTPDQIKFCQQNNIDPCTQNNILAKERVYTGGPGTRQTTEQVNPLSPINMLFLEIGIVSLIGAIAVAFVAKTVRRPSTKNNFS
jgi:hypothetical protein